MDRFSNRLISEISPGASSAEIPDLVVNPGIERLVLLPAGRPLPNSAELLGSPRMVMLVNDIKSRYSDDRIIIIDSSSMLTCAENMEGRGRRSWEKGCAGCAFSYVHTADPRDQR